MGKNIILTLAMSVVMFVSFDSFALDKIVRADSLNGRWTGQDYNGRPCWIEISRAQYELDDEWTTPYYIVATWTGDGMNTCTPYKGTMDVRMFFDGSLIDANVTQDNLWTPSDVDPGGDAHGYAMNHFNRLRDNSSVSIELNFNWPEGVGNDSAGMSENFSKIVDSLYVQWAYYENSSFFGGTTRTCLDLVKQAN